MKFIQTFNENYIIVSGVNRVVLKLLDAAEQVDFLAPTGAS